jgi:hypothetical protein
MIGRHKFSELVEQMPPERRARVDWTAEKLRKETGCELEITARFPNHDAPSRNVSDLGEGKTG